MTMRLDADERVLEAAMSQSETNPPRRDFLRWLFPGGVPHDPKSVVFAGLLLGLPLIILAAPWMDWFLGVAVFVGRGNDLAIYLALALLIPLLGLAQSLQGRKEAYVAFGLLFVLVWGLGVGVTQSLIPFLSVGGMLTIAAASILALRSYVFERDGHLMTRVFWGIVGATVISLPVPIALIALKPDAFKNFMLFVYGSGNVRAYGELAVIPVAAVGAAVFAYSPKGAKLTRVLTIGLVGVVCWGMLFWSGTRAGYVAALAVPVVIGIAMLISGRRKQALNGVLANGVHVVLGAVLSLTLPTPGGGSFGLINRIQKTASGLDTGSAATATSERSDVWAWALGQVRQEPMFGHGYFSMGGIPKDERAFQLFHTHNIFIEYLYGFGIPVGLFAGIGLLTLAAWPVFRLARGGFSPSPTLLAMIGVEGSLLVCACFASTLFTPLTMLIFALALGSAIGRITRTG